MNQYSRFRVSTGYVLSAESMGRMATSMDALSAETKRTIAATQRLIDAMVAMLPWYRRLAWFIRQRWRVFEGRMTARCSAA